MTNLPTAAAKSLQSCQTLYDPTDGSPPGSPVPGILQNPGKNTGVGCHFLLQCMKVKSESEVAQSCPTLRDPMDCSPPGYSVHGIFQARVLEWVAIVFSGPWVGVYLIGKERHERLANSNKVLIVWYQSLVPQNFKENKNRWKLEQFREPSREVSHLQQG